MNQSNVPAPADSPSTNELPENIRKSLEKGIFLGNVGETSGPVQIEISNWTRFVNRNFIPINAAQPMPAAVDWDRMQLFTAVPNFDNKNTNIYSLSLTSLSQTGQSSVTGMSTGLGFGPDSELLFTCYGEGSAQGGTFQTKSNQGLYGGQRIDTGLASAMVMTNGVLACAFDLANGNTVLRWYNLNPQTGWVERVGQDVPWPSPWTVATPHHGTGLLYFAGYSTSDLQIIAYNVKTRQQAFVKHLGLPGYTLSPNFTVFGAGNRLFNVTREFSIYNSWTPQQVRAFDGATGNEIVLQNPILFAPTVQVRAMTVDETGSALFIAHSGPDNTYISIHDAITGDLLSRTKMPYPTKWTSYRPLDPTFMEVSPDGRLLAVVDYFSANVTTFNILRSAFPKTPTSDLPSLPRRGCLCSFAFIPKCIGMSPVGNKVTIGGGVGSSELLLFVPQNDGTVAIQSASNPACFLAMEAIQAVHTPSGTGSVEVYQYTGKPAAPGVPVPLPLQCKFYMSKEQTKIWNIIVWEKWTVESAAYPGVFLRADGNTTTVNCQRGAADYEKFLLFPI